jgi:hypothetical protein
MVLINSEGKIQDLSKILVILYSNLYVYTIFVRNFYCFDEFDENRTAKLRENRN